MSDETFRRVETQRLDAVARMVGREQAKKPAVRGAARKIQEALDQTADAVADKAAATSDKVRDIVEVASDRIQATVDTIDPFVKQRPYAALGIGVAVGMMFGLLVAGRGPKVIYLKPPRAAH